LITTAPKHHYSSLLQLAFPDPKLLLIQPFDKGSFEEIEKAIQNSDIGLNPATDGDVIRIPIPSLSEERRKELTKVASKFTEDSKISLRSHRRTGIDELNKVKDDISADDIKRFETQIQELTDKYVKKVDELLSVKQNELLEV
jgi:ribosome recycling factor